MVIYKHSKDLENCKKIAAVIEETENLSKNQKWSLHRYCDEAITSDDLAPFGKKPEERKDCLLQHLGYMLLNGSLYEESHNDYTAYNLFITGIKKANIDDNFNYICDAFLMDRENAEEKISDMIHSVEADWTK